MTYQDWIDANVEGSGYGRCREVTEAMAAAFPELTRVRGHYYCPVWGEREHWWLVTPDREIVDPTRLQFPSRGVGPYVPHAGPEPTGRCPNCGDYVYDGRTCCSDNCYHEFAAHCVFPW